MYLVYYLYVTVFNSFFFSAYADDNDPKQVLFDQFIDAIVPLIIVSFFNMNLDRINNIRWFKVKLFLDDILFLLSLYILPSVIMIKNRETHNTPIWVIILYGVATFIIVIDIALIRFVDTEGKFFQIFIMSGIFMRTVGFVQVISDICFLFYSLAVYTNPLSKIFVYLHAVSGIILCFEILLALIIFLLSLLCENEIFIVFSMKLMIYSQFFIPFFLLYTPLIQMLNMALLSGNDYYWTKLIFASNLIYISRVLSYLKDVYFYYANIWHKGYRSLIALFIYAACCGFEWEDVRLDSKFLKLHTFLKYGNSEVIVKEYDNIGYMLEISNFIISEYTL